MRANVELVRLNNMTTLGDQLDKVREELLEVMAAMMKKGEGAQERVEEEVCDLLTAVAGLGFLYGVDLERGMVNCNKRNEERGRL